MARVRRLLFILLPGVAAILGLWAFWWEPASLSNEIHRLEIPGWPAACDGLRLALVADLHVGSPFNGVDRLTEVVAAIHAVRPELILLAGDYVVSGVLGGELVEPEALTGPLARLEAPLGVYAVLGNHDWWHDGPRVRRALEEAGIVVLENRAVRLQDTGCSFWLAGLGDVRAGRPDIEGALAPVPAGDAVLAFTHNPDLFPAIPPRVSLTLAGHTHGGQVAFPVVGRLIVPSRYGQRYAIGHVAEGGRHLFVTPGVGTSILPVRFRVPPEVSVLVLDGA